MFSSYRLRTRRNAVLMSVVCVRLSPPASKIITVDQHAQKTDLSQLIFQRVEKPNVRISCHFKHLAKIPGMKSISKPRLPFKIYTF
jgi:hypothetical protein